MERELRNHLSSLYRAFCAASDKTPSTIAYDSAGDRMFYVRIRTKSFTVRKYDSVVAWFWKNWPENLQWPSDIDPPASHKKRAA